MKYLKTLDMKYYKTLDIENIDIIIQKCLSYARSHTAYNRKNGTWNTISVSELTTVCPELAIGLQKHGFTIHMAALFVMYSPSHASIHLDNYYAQARINIPLLNCENTYTNFYECIGGCKKYVNAANVTTYEPTGDCKLVDRVELKQATIIRTRVFHSVDLPINNPVPRITLTLGLDKDPVFMLE
jgi:hypothetical protein